MKRFIFVLALVCTVFFGCGVTSALAFDTGDVINGKTLDFSNFSDETVDFLHDCKYYVCFEGYSQIYISKVPFVGGVYSLTFGYPEKNVVMYYGNSYCPYFTGSSIYYEGHPIISSSHTIYDSSGNVVFQVAPPVQPTQTAAPVGAVQGVTTEMMMQVLAELKPIILGLIVSVVGFVAFRKAWTWVLTNFIKV